MTVYWQQQKNYSIINRSRILVKLNLQLSPPKKHTLKARLNTPEEKRKMIKKPESHARRQRGLYGRE